MDINIGKEWRFMDTLYNTDGSITNYSKAWNFACENHVGQKYGNKPYLFHLQSVVNTAISLGYKDEEILIACALHDTIEDTDVSYTDIKDFFGKKVAEIVYCVTDELGRNRKERKSKTYKKIYDNPKAIVVKLCDRISNMYESMGTENYNLRLIKMYLDEHESFVDGIYNEDSLELTQKAWNDYNSVVLQLDYMFTDINDTLKHIENE